MDTTTPRRTWPRLVLTLSPDQGVALRELARANFRDEKQEALRLIAEGLTREARPRREAAR